MKVAVRYYTKTGNTKRLAEAVAAAAGTEALPISTPVTEQVDVLFLGNSYYAFTIDPEVRTFVRNLDKDKVGRKRKRTKPVFPWTRRNFTAKANSRESIRAGRTKKT